MYRILIVDADESTGPLISQYGLWNRGEFTIADMAGNGSEALLKLQQSHYDLVITDIQLPEMDGLELCRRIRDKGYDTVIVLASICRDFACAKEGMRMGVADYLEKPYTEENLEESLNLAARCLMRGNTGREQELYQAVIDGKQPPEILAKGFVSVMKHVWGSQATKRRAEETRILNRVFERMKENYPWLEVLETMDIIVGEEEDESVAMIFNEWESIVARYGLRFPDLLVEKIEKTIRQGLNQERVQDYLSEQMELSKDYMGKLFRNRLGVTISEYCTRLKMEKAKFLLRETNKKVYEIGEELGYVTVDYFTRLFKNYTGVTPANYRKGGNGISDL